MGRLSALQLFDIARAAGFPSDTAVKMVAIALRESGGDPNAHNGVPPDDSYGLWQINMLGKLLPQRLQLFGIPRASDLFDPATNARAAYILWGGNDNNLNVAWAINKNGAVPWKDRYEANLPAALAARARREGSGGGPVLASSGGPGDVSFPPASPLPLQALTLIPLAAFGTRSLPCLAWLSPSSPGSSSSTPSLEAALISLEQFYGAGALAAALVRRLPGGTT